MPIAVNLHAEGADDTALRKLWDQAARFEDEPSMASLGYPPHVTLAVYETAAAERVRGAAAALFAEAPALRLAFRRIAWFPAEPLILYAAPEPSNAFDALHRRLHGMIAPELCSPHYRPGSLVPHCTLALRIMPDRRAAAIDFATRETLSLDVSFTIGDVALFYPVRVFDEWRLRPRDRP